VNITSTRPSPGFSLIELLIATSLLIGSALSFHDIQYRAHQLNLHSFQSRQANQLTNSIETLLTINSRESLNSTDFSNIRLQSTTQPNDTSAKNTTPLDPIVQEWQRQLDTLPDGHLQITRQSRPHTLAFQLQISWQTASGIRTHQEKQLIL